MSDPTTDVARTLGSLGAADLGQVLTIRRGPATWTGVLTEVRHHRGDTSGRPVTTYQIVWRDSGTSLHRMHNHHGSGSNHVAMPDDSNGPCEVRPEPCNPPGSTEHGDDPNGGRPPS